MKWDIFRRMGIQFGEDRDERKRETPPVKPEDQETVLSNPNIPPEEPIQRPENKG
jgi:hypothetical protein